MTRKHFSLDTIVSAPMAWPIPLQHLEPSLPVRACYPRPWRGGGGFRTVHTHLWRGNNAALHGAALEVHVPDTPRGLEDIPHPPGYMRGLREDIKERTGVRGCVSITAMDDCLVSPPATCRAGLSRARESYDMLDTLRIVMAAAQHGLPRACLPVTVAPAACSRVSSLGSRAEWRLLIGCASRDSSNRMAQQSPALAIICVCFRLVNSCNNRGDSNKRRSRRVMLRQSRLSPGRDAVGQTYNISSGDHRHQRARAARVAVEPRPCVELSLRNKEGFGQRVLEHLHAARPARDGRTRVCIGGTVCTATHTR
jgi:hypothetical protein